MSGMIVCWTLTSLRLGGDSLGAKRYKNRQYIFGSVLKMEASQEEGFERRHILLVAYTVENPSNSFNVVVLLLHYLSEERLGAGREGLEDWGKVSEGLRDWFWERKKVSGVIDVISMALYDLFGGADEPDLEILRERCFRYFELGGDRVACAVGLLSA
ncbi:squalene epoxidase-domain-containing protein [Dioszegia hungarica]|uniref:Squalene monooxygenase n=1 Tax=Dioszegia hungarica TaxID=4972 RepID=A0AA38LPC3_9TREE|nr:squalene epoxidase-domain-containing protein [Dioszegia hungarica]KAI9631812.1 squalene epoxidase-domain-containing protein [Dioszegia hungarica]